MSKAEKKILLKVDNVGVLKNDKWLVRGVSLEVKQGEIVTLIQDASSRYDGIVINPGGYSHTSVSILDALKIYKGVKIEVHLSKLSSRKVDYRQKMITAEGVDILLEGLLDLSYFIGVFTIY